MKNTVVIPIIFVLLAWAPLSTLAETVYINDRFMVGMHEENSIDSVISKLLPSGTSLDMIKKDEPMSQVREPDGTIGWVDNQYLVYSEPGRARLAEAENRITELEKALAKAGEDRAAETAGAVADEGTQQIINENRELKQLLKTERLRVGELQAETAELKNRLSGTVVTKQAAEELQNLQAVNARLREQLVVLQSDAEQSGESRAADMDVRAMLGDFDWRKMLITIAVSLVIGILAGMYILDWVHRRRHGGFRI